MDGFGVFSIQINVYLLSFVGSQLPSHDITLEAAWPELFIDNNGKYWDVPESISFDCLSLVSESGLRYRFGIHRNRGLPQSVNPSISAEAPLALEPGYCAKAALSYEKSKDLWRQEETAEDPLEMISSGEFGRLGYDFRLREPHSAISGIIGSFAAPLIFLFSFYTSMTFFLPFHFYIIHSTSYSFSEFSKFKSFPDLTQ